MLQREACERRVYRLALLLTGNVRGAAAVIREVVGVQPDLRTMDSAHMDRLTVLRSREVPVGRLDTGAVPEVIANALASLPAQQRETWVFARVYAMDLRSIAKAMDCSASATQRHLEAADAAMAVALESHPGGAEGAAAALRAFTMEVDVPAFYRAAQRRRRSIRLAVIGSVLAIAGLAFILVTAWVLGWFAVP